MPDHHRMAEMRRRDTSGRNWAAAPGGAALISSGDQHSFQGQSCQPAALDGSLYEYFGYSH